MSEPYQFRFHTWFAKNIATLAGSADKGDGTWTLEFLDGTRRPATAAEVASARAYADGLTVGDAKNSTDASAARSDAKLQAFFAMSPAQVRAWILLNVTTLADAKDALATLAVAVSALMRDR